MARFPEAEADIAALALLVTEGLAKSSEDFPAPPISAEELKAQLEAYNTARTSTVDAETAVRRQHAVKDEALNKLVDSLKAVLKYAEVVARNEPEKLSQLGWGPRRSSSSLDAPGEVRDIAIRAEGDTWVVLDWKPPVGGGAPAAYTVQRRPKGEDSWENVATSFDVEELLSNQPRGVALEYRVVAVNKAGTGQPSATATLVL